MLQNIVKLAKENWFFFLIVIVVVMILFFMNRRENYYDYKLVGCSSCTAGDAGVLVDNEVTGCSTCSAGDAGVLVDSEITGCSTCSAGEAGVLVDSEEMYQMPDDYYETPMEIADTIAEVAHNPDMVEAVVEDKEDEVYDDEEEKVIDPTNYAAQSDNQLMKDFYGDDEIDYKERKRIHEVRFAPIEFLENDGAFTLL